MATVIIPTPLRKFTNQASKLNVEASTVGEALQRLVQEYPDLRKHLLDDQGQIRPFLNLFVGEEDVRDLQWADTPLSADATLSIVPAIAGGTTQRAEATFSEEELARYHRHIIIPEFGLEGQQKLKTARVLVVGSGGLGSPLLLYLAAAGVGTIGIVDFDRVEASNLQRQVLFGVDTVGQSKVEAARQRLTALNPHIRILTYDVLLNSRNALDIIREYDVVADGTDNFPTRYLVNDACVLLGKPNVYASIFQFEGQVSVFNYRHPNGELGPNYRDLYPAPPPPGLVPSCAEGGVLGVLPGIIGSMQACEVIKVITGIGEPLSGRLFLFDALSFETRIFRIKRRDDNPLTGKNPTITQLIDYENFCGVKVVEKPIREITPQELLQWRAEGRAFQLIDVREPDEYAAVNINAELIPLGTVVENAHRLSRQVPVVVHCRSGARSAKAIRELEERFGFDNLYNLKGGILAYLEAEKQAVEHA
ncbi:MAG: molybdopterin-synthase adenylyltransferase MoeB [Saprospiraceae bacterium]|nr:molybdopterin-synthase adenylyltransferase MoeB [Saprospiraceae bacterium]MDW8483653.1 molybdopterin-synthase adenylyltransferase MoeB [Saprospiraceae bacterium]